jgi:hypothetical protein
MTTQTIQLQSVGHVEAVAACEMKAGDVRMYNFGSTSTIVKVIEKSAKTLSVIEYSVSSDSYYMYDLRKTTLVAIVESGKDVSEHKPQQINHRKLGMVDVSEYFPIVEEVATIEETTQEKIEVESITFNWSESYQVEEGQTVKTFSEAEQIIFNIASHKTSGGYDKTNFTITWKDGHTYTGRIDVLSSYTSGQELKKHVEAHCLYFAGMAKQSNMEQYKNNLRAFGITEEDQKEYRLFLDTYLLEDIETTLEPELATIEEVEVNTESTNEIIGYIVTESEEKQTATFYQINAELNGVEIYFDSKPSEEVRNQMKVLKFRWARNKGCWYAKQSDDAISLAKQLAKEVDQVANESPLSYPEIEINDKTDSKYTIPQSLIDREHDSNWIFRKEKKDYNKEIQDYFTECNEKVLEVISTTKNEYYIFKLKEALQRFKKNYHAQYVKYLTTKGNNPSWAVTGRAGRNMSKYNKDMDRQDNIMMELASLPEEFNSLISKYKNKIKKDKLNKEKQQLQEAIQQGLPELKFKAVTKEMDLYDNGITVKSRFYEYEYYSIVKVWGAFRVYYKGKEIHSTKSNGTLKQAKEYVAYLVQQDQQKAV